MEHDDDETGGEADNDEGLVDEMDEMKQPKKPVYRALGNPTRGKVTESK